MFYRLKGVKPNDYSFSIVSENKMLKYLGRLGAKKATGLDDIPARFVIDTIACPLRHVINLSLWSSAWKGLTSWLSFVVSYCEFVTFPLVSWVRCGA